MPQMTEAYEWHGRNVVDKAREPVGKIEEIYRDQLSGEPEWALVQTGLFGSRPHLVPLAGSSPDGEDVRVQVLKEQVQGAPTLEAGEQLSDHQERQLFAHYRMQFAEPRPETGIAAQVRASRNGTANGRAVDDGPTAPRRAATRAEAAPPDLADQPGLPLSEPGSDSRANEAITRSEEELRIGLERRERGRVRLRKYVVTEQVTKTVPVRREVLRVEREPITEPSRHGALPESGITEEEHEVLLYEEEPIVEKRIVPKERVRLYTEVVEDQREISEELRKEQIETDARDR
ncbi:MAG: YsnF/AvaK domain-containing protein [Solirubrobacteraceae bacterium]